MGIFFCFNICFFPFQLGILLNSMKRMLDVLRPKIESLFKSWGSCIPDRGNAVPVERLSGVTVMLRTKFRNYLQAVDEKLAENVSILLKVTQFLLLVWLLFYESRWNISLKVNEIYHVSVNWRKKLCCRKRENIII